MTSATPNGPGGKPMPLDPVENPDGNLAARPTTRGRLVARVLGKEETHDVESEYRAMPHFATCQPALVETPAPLPANVVDFGKARRDRGAHR